MKRFISYLKASIWIFVFAMTLSSCFTTRIGPHPETFVVDEFPKFRKQCIGQSYNKIVVNLGAPKRREPDGNGGNILIYENSTTTSVSQTVAKAYNVDFFRRTYTPGTETSTEQITNTEYIHYFLNADNICYEVKTNIPMKREVTRTVNGKYKKFSWTKTLGLLTLIEIPIILAAVLNSTE